MSELPPLNINGQPERANASSKENARMVFSTNAISRTPAFCAASVIHLRDLLLGLIIVYRLNDLYYFLFSVTTRGISQQLAFVDVIPFKGKFINIVCL